MDINLKDYGSWSSYERLCKIYNLFLKRALEIDSEILHGCELPLFDPELFRFKWIKESIFSGICFEVRRINLDVEDPSSLPLSEKIKPWGDVLQARLLIGDLQYHNFYIDRKFQFEQLYSLPEDFNQMVTDVVQMVREHS